MNLIGKQLLLDFKKKHSDASSHIDSWIAEVEEEQWDTPHDIKKRYPKASIVNQYVVFNICWNKYRLLTQVSYKNKVVLVTKIGTHKEYDKWNLK